LPISSSYSRTGVRGRESMIVWLSFSSVWVAATSLAIALAMLVHRPVLTDLAIVAVLYFGAPGALCFAGLTLWANRKESVEDPAVVAQRLQAKVAIALAIVAAAIVYALIIFSEKIEPGIP